MRASSVLDRQTQPPLRRRATRGQGRSVSARLTRSLTTYVLLLLLLAGFGIANALVLAHGGRAELRQERLREANTQMLLAMTNAETGVRGYRLVGDPVFLEPYERGRVDFPEAVRRSSALSTRDDERALVRAQREVGRGWFADFADVVAAQPRDGQPPTLEEELALKVEFDGFRALNSRLDVLVERRAQVVATEAAHARWIVRSLSVLAVLVSLVVAARVHRRLRAALVTPLDAVVATLGLLTAGRHGARADADLGAREIQVVATSLNELADEADRLREDQAAVARSQEVAVGISRAIRDELGDGDPVAEALRLLGAELEVDRVYVRQLDGDDHSQVEKQWMRPPLAPLPPSPGDGRYDRETTERSRAIYAAMSSWANDDTAVTGRDDPVTRTFVQRTGARAAVAVPIGAGPETMGMLVVVQTTGPRRWDEHEIGVISSVAADLGRALVVARLLKQQEHLVEQLRELDRAKTDFLSTVSHELRTPLTSIAGYLEMVREGDGGEVPPAMDEMLVVVERNAARLRSLIEDLLTLSRIESGAYRVTHEEVCLAETAAMVVQSMRPAAEKGKVTVALEIAQADALVIGDPGQLERAVTNLVSNAVKFTPAGGWVRLATRVAGGRVVLEVADTGIGIPTGEQRQLFTRFFRASNATEQAIPGTGLGLTIVRSIVEHHGGELRLASVVGEGTTVTVDLPLLAGSRSAAATAAARASVAASVASLAHDELAARAPSTVGAR